MYIIPSLSDWIVWYRPWSTAAASEAGDPDGRTADVPVKEKVKQNKSSSCLFLTG